MEQFSQNLKRPLAVFGLVFSVGMAVALLFGAKLIFALAAASLLLLCLLFIKGQKPKLSSLAAVMFAALLFCSAAGYKAEKEMDYTTGMLSNNLVDAVVTVTAKNRTTGMLYADIDSAFGEAVTGVSAGFYCDQLAVGDIARVHLELRDPSEYPRALDKMALYYADAELVAKEPYGSEYLRALSGIKGEFINRLSYYMGEEAAALVGALITGDRTGIAPSYREALEVSGIAHILSVSGLHISAIAVAIKFLFDNFIPNRFAAFAAKTAAVLLAALFFGATPSVIRAAAMAIYFFAAKAVGRQGDSATAISLASVVVLLLNPYCVTRAGYLLSFGCIAALLLIYPRIVKLWSKEFSKTNIARRLLKPCKALGATLIIQLFTLPVLLAFGMKVSLVSPVMNLAVLPLVPLLMLSGFLAAVLYPFPLLGGIFGGICSAGAKIVMFLVDTVSGLGFAAVRVFSPRMMVMTVFFALALVLLLCGKGRMIRFSALAAAGIAAAALLLAPRCSIAALDGNAYISSGTDCAVVITNSDDAALFDIACLQRTGFAGAVRYAIILESDVDNDAVAKVFPKAKLVSGGLCSVGRVHLKTAGGRVHLIHQGGSVLLSANGGDNTADAVVVLAGAKTPFLPGQLSAAPPWHSQQPDISYSGYHCAVLEYYPLFGYYLGKSSK